MQEIFLDCYIKISILIAVTDLVLAVKSFRKNRTTGRFLGFSCLAAAVVDVSYLISILNENYLFMSVMSSIYFASIDVMLVCLLIFTIFFTKCRMTKAGRKGICFVLLYMIFEIVVFAVNPFWEIAVSYQKRSTFVAQYSYQMKPLYRMHLAFSYLLVILIVALLLYKMYKSPGEYRRQYQFVILEIVGIVAVNGVFLFQPDVSVYNLLDYSICGYSLTAYLLYWSCFDYATHGLLNRLKTSIFENIDQSIVLFDYDDNLILHNKKADCLLETEDFEEVSQLGDFVKRYQIALNQDMEERCSLQCFIQGRDGVRPLRCDVCLLKNGKGQEQGRLFVFSDAALEIDLLTGFQNWDSFRKLAKENADQYIYPTAVAMCDIDSLSLINSTLGHNAGDQKIRQLADVMRSCFPKRTHYVRGHEANLIALCSNCSEDEMRRYLAQVRENFVDPIQYGISIMTKDNPDLLEAVHFAFCGMRTKKILDQESIRSGMLISLIRALEECDSDTESHVRRTQLMGAELGKRIGLTDMQQSELSLLCLLHDIGKIGVPLEILNKPGKLTEEEWRILRSHTAKGYEIAKSNKEISGIADAILHHHERWDGHGYPDGLSGEEIPLLSRVIAVVDAYDAMVSNRSYRPAMPRKKAMEELERCAGSQFDPVITARFLEMLREKPAAVENPQTRESFGGRTMSERIRLSALIDGQTQDCGPCIHPIVFSRYLVDGNMRILSVDENFEKLTGYTKEDLAEKPLLQFELIPESERTEYIRLASALANSQMLYLEHRLLRKDGTIRPVFCLGRVYYDSAARLERLEIIITDISNSDSGRMPTGSEKSRA